MGYFSFLFKIKNVENVANLNMFYSKYKYFFKGKQPSQFIFPDALSESFY